MSSIYTPAPTAEQVIAVVDAVGAFGKIADLAKISEFTSVAESRVKSALALAEAVGLIKVNSSDYELAANYARLMSSRDALQKAALLRLSLESFQPFRVFRERLRITGSADTAARETCAVLGIKDDPTDVFHTLTSLATYCQVIRTTGNGEYEIVDGLTKDVISAPRASP